MRRTPWHKVLIAPHINHLRVAAARTAPTTNAAYWKDTRMHVGQKQKGCAPSVSVTTHAQFGTGLQRGWVNATRPTTVGYKKGGEHAALVSNAGCCAAQAPDSSGAPPMHQPPTSASVTGKRTWGACHHVRHPSALCPAAATERVKSSGRGQPSCATKGRAMPPNRLSTCLRHRCKQGHRRHSQLRHAAAAV